MTSILHINTRDVAPPQRLAYWNEYIGDLYGGMSVDSDEPDFSARLTYVDVGKIGFMRARSVHSFVQRKGDNHQDETVLLHIQAQGRSVNCQGGREVVLQPGEFTICENRSVYTIEPLGVSDVIALEIPYGIAKSHIPDIEKRIIHRYSSYSLQGRVLYSILQTIQSECQVNGAEALNLSSLEPMLMGVIAQLVALPSEGREFESRRAGPLLKKVKNIIRQNLGDDSLSIEQLAEQAGLSERRVQALFAATGTTPTHYIRDTRLDWAAERLRFEPSISITQIAYEVGFSDSAYFARCFRKKYGVSPKDYRVT